MNSDSILKFFLLIFVAGLLGGTMFGFMLALAMLAILYSPILSLAITFFIFLFYIPGIWKQIKIGKWLYIVRKLIEALCFGSLFTSLFLLEEGTIYFNDFVWLVIIISLILVIIPLTLFLIIAEYYNESWLNQEIGHIIKGMQMYGLLPNEDKVKDKVEDKEK